MTTSLPVLRRLGALEPLPQVRKRDGPLESQTRVVCRWQSLNPKRDDSLPGVDPEISGTRTIPTEQPAELLSQ